MALAANVVRSAFCSNCRQSLLRNFIVGIGGSQALPPIPSHRSVRQRRLHTTPPTRSDDLFALNDINEQYSNHTVDEKRGPTNREDSGWNSPDQDKGKAAERQEVKSSQTNVLPTERNDRFELLVSGREIVDALEELDVRDTWDEIVTLWQEDRMQDARQLLDLLLEEMTSVRGKDRTDEHHTIIRALKGRPKHMIPAIVDAIEKAEDAEVESNNKLDLPQSAQEHRKSTAPGESSSSLPWYLQPSLHPHSQSATMASPPALPALPLNSPPVLSPLLTHLSNELGMDSISLLDLRTLDPPPALGSNLLMLICTARSEKHLHTSADRFCRHLRSTYRLSPYADGLLGRNELKLKLRRKAKRSKLFSAVGAKATGSGEIDDGIRTGWVCVNVGRVEGGDLPEEVSKVQRREGFVGFGGSGEEGSRIVVQMLTAEKRGEMDLETLWMGILRRAEADKAKAQDDAPLEGSAEDVLRGDGEPKKEEVLSASPV